MTDDLLTYEEAARIVHVSPETIRYWIKTNRLPTVPARISKRSGKPWGQRVRARDVYAATEDGLIKKLQQDHPDLELLTTNEIKHRLGIHDSLLRSWIKFYGLKKYKLHPGSYSFLLSYKVLLESLEQDFYNSPYVTKAYRKNRRVACGCHYCMLD